MTGEYGAILDLEGTLAPRSGGQAKDSADSFSQPSLLLPSMQDLQRLAAFVEEDQGRVGDSMSRSEGPSLRGVHVRQYKTHSSAKLGSERVDHAL